MARLAIIGASEHQLQLIRKAKEKGHETHVFAWAAGDVGEREADVFYPVSITEQQEITRICREVGVDGVCTIGTDLGNATAGAVAFNLGLPCNTPECVQATTDKGIMRQRFAAAGSPSPKSILVKEGEYPVLDGFQFPLIVKPIDRSGSRGITKISCVDELDDALDAAFEVGFEKRALVEEFAEGREFSIEGMSWNGNHAILAITEKFTTGAPHFIERGHLQPARISANEAARIREVVSNALDALGVRMGASHAELKMADDGTIRIIEIASRMGGDCIGSDLVQLSTGIDFVGAVVDAALGIQPNLLPNPRCVHAHAAVRFSFGPSDTSELRDLMAAHPEWVVRDTLIDSEEHAVTDSSTRSGCVVFAFEETLERVDLGLW